MSHLSHSDPNLILSIDAAVCIMILISCLTHLILLIHAVKQDHMLYHRSKAKVILDFMSRTFVCGAMILKSMWYFSLLVGATWLVVDEFIIQLAVLSTFWMVICAGLTNLLDDLSDQKKLLVQLKSVTEQADRDYENHRETG